MNRLILVTSLVFVTTVPLYGDEKPEPLYEGKPLEYWVKRLKTSETRVQREEAAGAVREFGPDAAPAVPILVSMLDDRSWQYRHMVGELLYDLGPVAKAAVPALVQSLKKKTACDPGIVITVLGSIGPDAQAATAVIIAALNDSDLMESAFETLCKIKPLTDHAIPALRVALRKARVWGDENRNIFEDRYRKLMGYLEIFGVAASPLLVELLDDKEPWIQRAAADSLRKFGPAAKQAVPALIKSMRSEHEQVRLAAAFALLKIDKNPDAVVVVTSLLSEPTEGGLFSGGPRGALMAESSRATSAETATILGEVGPAAKSALPALRKLLSSKYESLQKVAREAIRKIEHPETKP